MSAPSPRVLSSLWVATSLLLALFAIVFSPPTAPGGGGPKKDAKKKNEAKNDAQFQGYLKQLHNRFQEWDRNNDNILDKAELAKAFRGAKALAYDELPPPKTLVFLPKITPLPTTPVAKAQVKSTSIMLASLPKGGLPVNLVLAELLTRPRSSSVPKTTAAPIPEATVITAPPVNVNLFPDVQFLQHLGKVKAGRISKPEFDNWAKDYAQLRDRYTDNEREVKTAQLNVQKAKNPKARQEAQNNLQRQEKELQQVQVELSKIPAAIHQAFHLKP